MRQLITSAGTSINKTPRLFKQVDLKRGTVNLDVGGGKYETTTDYLHGLGVHNFVYDPFNRCDKHNARVWKLLVSYSQADTATLSNVLNVIRERRHRVAALRVAGQAIGNRGVCYITVYGGDRSGRGKRTTKGWQCHRALKTYLKEVRSVFSEVIIQPGGVIVAFNAGGPIVRARSTRG